MLGLLALASSLELDARLVQPEAGKPVPSAGAPTLAAKAGIAVAVQPDGSTGRARGAAVELGARNAASAAECELESSAWKEKNGDSTSGLYEWQLNPLLPWWLCGEDFAHGGGFLHGIDQAVRTCFRSNLNDTLKDNKEGAAGGRLPPAAKPGDVFQVRELPAAWGMAKPKYEHPLVVILGDVDGSDAQKKHFKVMLVDREYELKFPNFKPGTKEQLANFSAADLEPVSGKGAQEARVVHALAKCTTGDGELRQRLVYMCAVTECGRRKQWMKQSFEADWYYHKDQEGADAPKSKEAMAKIKAKLVEKRARLAKLVAEPAELQRLAAVEAKLALEKDAPIFTEFGVTDADLTMMQVAASLLKLGVIDDILRSFGAGAGGQEHASGSSRTATVHHKDNDHKQARDKLTDQVKADWASEMHQQQTRGAKAPAVADGEQNTGANGALAVALVWLGL